MKSAPYIVFYGNCRQALALYEKAFAPALLKITTFKEKYSKIGIPVPERAEDYIYRAELTLQDDKNTSTLVFCDSPTIIFAEVESGNVKDNLTVLITSGSKEQLVTAFNMLLADGGKVNYEMKQTDTSEMSGSIIDKYGIHWFMEYA